MEKSLSGLNSSTGFEFAPSAKASFAVTKKVALGVEYYSSLGLIGNFNDLADQQHQIFPTVDLEFSEDWESNFEVGFGLTHSTDGLVVKLIFGRRF